MPAAASRPASRASSRPPNSSQRLASSSQASEEAAQDSIQRPTKKPRVQSHSVANKSHHESSLGPSSSRKVDRPAASAKKKLPAIMEDDGEGDSNIEDTERTLQSVAEFLSSGSLELEASQDEYSASDGEDEVEAEAEAEAEEEDIDIDQIDESDEGDEDDEDIEDINLKGKNVPGRKQVAVEPARKKPGPKPKPKPMTKAQLPSKTARGVDIYDPSACGT
jgi:hypothetical protein